MHMYTYIEYINFGTEKTRVELEQVKQEFPSFSTFLFTRFPAKFCSSARVRMFGEDSRNM